MNARLASVVRREPVPDLPAGKRWSTSRDPESALLTLATDDTLSPQKRANAARLYGYEVDGDASIDAYSLASLPTTGSAR
jgi:hypothetical protein